MIIVIPIITCVVFLVLFFRYKHFFVSTKDSFTISFLIAQLDAEPIVIKVFHLLTQSFIFLIPDSEI